ncbi:Cytochrome c550 [Beijerinckiaceae bacterium RH AL1]|jgi:cytochrome c-550 PedF|nr:cytochrome c-550 PedF [Beijerinckiaceae bacterium]VVB44619.1 Cytochrome c550 [Beijerinckiaceae bacterium RH CH11]VVB44697.1 Cytochrome c550 [Beijerinckiaceae bacterium RH AL8]VVC54450.1 Cytochrome c550 [Beijerinckiaceae bacterium RH AL1]
MKVWFIAAGVVALAVAATAPVFGHGSVTPQAFDTPGLPDLGNTWKDTNPFRDSKDKEKAIEIGAHGYLANCAACHGLEMESGGMAPDLHQLPTGAEGDDLYKEKVINGVTRNGQVKMEKYFGTVSQTGLWAIRTYIESKHQD